MNSFEDVLEKMKERLSLEYTDITMESWINPLKFYKFDNETNKMFLYVESNFVKQILDNNYTEIFKRHLKDILGFDVDIEYVTRGDSTITTKDMVRITNPIPELDDDIYTKKKIAETDKNSNYNHTFDTFIVGESNRLAYAACKSIAQDQKTGGSSSDANPLYIYSEPGLGKTHLLFAVMNEVKLRHPELNIIYVSSETFVNEYIEHINKKTMNDFKKKYRSADMLLVDDVQFFSGKEGSQEELFHTFNELHTNGKQIILTSDRPPKEINNIEARLKTRFEWGLLADISAPEFETRLAIIKRKAELFGLKIPNSVMEYMADKLKNNIRQIEGAITKMNHIVLIEKTAPTIIMAQGIIKEVMTEQQDIPITVEKIMTEVSHIFNVTPDDLRSKKRNSQVSTARQVAMYVISNVVGLSYTSIGTEFGNRDHSTVVYAINKVKDVMAKDPTYRDTVEDLIKNIENM